MPDLQIVKKAPGIQSSLEIQNSLASSYHFLKWQLVQVMEYEEREMK